MRLMMSFSGSLLPTASLPISRGWRFWRQAGRLKFPVLHSTGVAAPARTQIKTSGVYGLAYEVGDQCDAEAQLGHNDEAIRLFEMCKLIVNNKDFNKEIDEIVKNLKK